MLSVRLSSGSVVSGLIKCCFTELSALIIAEWLLVSAG